MNFMRTKVNSSNADAKKAFLVLTQNSSFELFEAILWSEWVKILVSQQIVLDIHSVDSGETQM